MMNVEELKIKYPMFRYHAYHMEEDAEQLRIMYDFEIVGLSEFHPTFTIKKPNEQIYSEEKLVRETVFSLGMVELVSYWKLTCSPNVIVECGDLDDWQIRWWKKLYYHGLGEFFFQNHIQADPNTFMNLTSTGDQITGTVVHRNYQGNLIPVGGGKDSFVSLSILEENHGQNHAFVINSIKSAVNSAHAAGYDGDRLITPKRTLDPNMLALNKEGYLNGHTPFSAMVSFASYLTAIIYGKKYICLSNEASANESTVKDSDVNHQYSKTFEYEMDFHAYTKRYLDDEILYFSLLRPLSELQITAIFSTLKPYHAIFRSCNVGQKEGVWCGHCAKCLFVGVMLSAYLDLDELSAIFGRDMLNDPEMLDLFEQLTGIQDNKPFECVGTRDEVNMAINLYIRKHEDRIPLLYEAYMKSEYYRYYKDIQPDFVTINEVHQVPSQYIERIHKKLELIK